MDETACIFSLDALIYRFTIVTTVFPFSDHGLTRDGRLQVLSMVGSGHVEYDTNLRWFCMLNCCLRAVIVRIRSVLQ